MPKHTFLEFVLGRVSGRGSWFAWSELLALPFLKSGVPIWKGGRKEAPDRTYQHLNPKNGKQGGFPSGRKLAGIENWFPVCSSEMF